MKNSEIRELSTKDIHERLEDARLQLTKAKLNHAVSPLENANVLKEMRATVARLLTELTSRGIAEQSK
ncbi:MAG: 50S ribosomal protein L29 [Bacteroidales bacterium]|nr:50S ribosomal protein L29 [Bacteroidales bacterium]RLD39304.1 MAG: 50S ribosomal protein L29 [Bacteroidota bacterium]